MVRISSVPSRFGLSFRFVAFWAFFWVSLGSKSASAADFIYVSMDNNTIVRYDVSLGDASAIAASMNVFVPTGQCLNAPCGLAFDRSGKLYVANNNVSARSISKFDSNGVFLLSWSTGTIAPRYLAFVPEPSTYILGGLATGLMAVIARRRKVKCQG